MKAIIKNGVANLDCWKDNWQSGKTDKLILLVDGVV